MVVYKVERNESSGTWRIHKYYRFMFIDWSMGLVNEAGSYFTAFYSSRSSAKRAIERLEEIDSIMHTKDKWVTEQV
jgi:hypothetical protein